MESDINKVFPELANSFSSQVREEISRTKVRGCCRQYVLLAILESLKDFQIYSGKVLRFSSLGCARFVSKILNSLEIDFLWTKSEEESEEGAWYIIKLLDLPELNEAKLKLESLNLDICCRRHWLSGLFLSFGSVCDPKREYRLDWVLPKIELAEKVQNFLQLDGIHSSRVLKKNNWVISVKKAEDISEVLTIIGANSSRMNYEEIRAFKETRNDVSRLVNAESANLARSSRSSFEQIESIHILLDSGKLQGLSQDLQDIANLRLEYPEASLRKLGQMCEPRLAVSTISRRLNKLEELASEVVSENNKGINL